MRSAQLTKCILVAIATALLSIVYGNPLLFESELPGLGVEPEVYMDATQLITSKGFPCENYWVNTSDGYILNLLRIPHGRNHNDIDNNGSRPVVFLQHGLMGDATNWITNPANESLAFLLADQGADVWLGNNRGNIYSINHTTLDPVKDEKKFWAFSWDEMAFIDLPTMVRFALNVSDAEQLYYAGHSQGTTIGFAKFSEDQEFASKYIKHFIALAPVARVGHSPSPFNKLAPFAKDFFKLFGHGKFSVEPEWLRVLQGDLCQRWTFADVCSNILFIISGFDGQSLNKTRLPIYMSHVPSGTSTQNEQHWAQEAMSKQFQKYDYYSAEENMKHYNQTTPPLYDPSKVKVPVAVFRGGHDWQADKEDVAWLLPQLQNVTKDVLVKHYEHLDFIWAFDAATGIYKDILDIVFER